MQMVSGRFDPTFEQLPTTLPIFPLPGVLLLPRGRLPLNIFEPRYLNMVEDALAADRIIGIIQPTGMSSEREGLVPGTAPVYPIGCAGRIAQFSETDDGRLLIALAGLIRFGVVSELAATRGYRRAVVSFERFRDDLAADDAKVIDRDRLIAALRAYFTLRGLSIDWAALSAADDENLVTSVAMICPFEASEKQALLESSNIAERGKLMTTLIEMSLLGSAGNDAPRH